MDTNKELNYRLFIQIEEGFERTEIRSEFSRYDDIKNGDVEKVRANFAYIRAHYYEGKGQLSDDPIRNLRYHLVVSVAVIARVCVAGGMGHDEAYTLGDIYIRKADVCNDYEGILDIFEEMRIDYAQRMHDMRKTTVISLHIRKCIDYIYEHLHEDLSVKTLSAVVGLETSYLSKLFSKETGSTIKHFVTKARINTAENLLKYSDHPCSEIAFALGFSSQSAFISVFKKENGITPRQYREQYYSATGLV